MDNELIKRVEDKVLDTMLLAQKLYNRVFELPKLSFDLNSIRVAGLAYRYDWKIKINPRFLAEHPEEVINVTVPHEIAHLLCFVLRPNAKQSHGPEWKGIMQDLGFHRPSTYHSMRLPDAKPHTYICSCQKFHLSNLVHKRILAGESRFCRKCKKKIVHLNSL